MVEWQRVVNYVRVVNSAGWCVRVVKCARRCGRVVKCGREVGYFCVVDWYGEVDWCVVLKLSCVVV